MKSNGLAGNMNNLLLGIAEVFDKSEEASYLEYRFKQWNVRAPSGYAPHLHELPEMCSAEKLPRLGEQERELKQEIDRRRKCMTSTLDFYFPLFDGETVKEDFFSFLVAPFASYPPGTVVARRTTNKAVMFAVVPEWRFDLKARTLAAVAPRVLLAKAGPGPQLLQAGQEVKLITGILTAFAGALPGPWGAGAKCGVGLLSAILGMAGDGGPSWDDIKKMMREVLREELITNDLEHIQAAYESVKRWSDITYLPNKQSGKSQEELWDMLSPQINLINQQISLLLQKNHRLPGFALLLLGVPMYLSLLQEQVALSYKADIKKAGNDWAGDMLQVWKEIQDDRKNQLRTVKYSYGVAEPSHTVITCYYWSWEDQKSGESKGSRSGPWQAGGKHDDSEARCKADAEQHYQAVLQEMIKTFADPQALAQSWRNVSQA